MVGGVVDIGVAEATPAAATPAAVITAVTDVDSIATTAIIVAAAAAAADGVATGVKTLAIILVLSGTMLYRAVCVEQLDHFRYRVK